MKAEVALSTTVRGHAHELAAFLSDMRNVERLHPLLTAVALETEAGRTRVWRCDDRIFGLPLTYFPEQRLDEDGLGYVSRTKQGGMTLTNTWRFEPLGDCTRVTEHLVFEGSRAVVWFSRRVGEKAHRGLFAAIEGEFGICQ
ncbi:MAG: SRPBCC family protein [Archangium sp.]